MTEHSPYQSTFTVLRECLVIAQNFLKHLVWAGEAVRP